MSAYEELGFINDHPEHRCAFNHMFDAVILDKPEEVISAADTISDLEDAPFTGDYVQYTARDYRDAACVALDDVHNRSAHAALKIGGKKLMCAYAYSGVPIEPNLVWLAMGRLDINPDDLGRFMQPDRGLLSLAGIEKAELSEAEKFIITWRGLTALSRLGLLRGAGNLHHRARLKCMDLEIRMEDMSAMKKLRNVTDARE